MSISREIRGWIEIRTRKKDDEKHPPFFTLLFSGTKFYT